MDADKRENFNRVAVRRTSQALDSLIRLGNLSKHNYYEYTPDQIEAIFSAIEDKMKEQKQRLLNRNEKFSLH